MLIFKIIRLSEIKKFSIQEIIKLHNFRLIRYLRVVGQNV